MEEVSDLLPRLLVDNNTSLSYLDIQFQDYFNTSSDYGFLNGSLEDTNSTSGSPLQSSGFENVVEKLNIFGIPAIIVIGILGNTFSFVVFVCTHLRYQSCSVYLAFLNLVDIGFLLCLGIIWFEWLRMNLLHRPVVCQCVVYLSYVCAFLSSWAVVTFTIERYIVVFYPLRKHVLCTPRRAKCIVSVITGIAALLYSFSIWMNGVAEYNGKKVCMPLKRYTKVLRGLTAADTLITFIIPSSTIIVLNIGIVFKICDFIYRRGRGGSFDTEDSGQRASGSPQLRVHHCSRPQGSTQFCKMQLSRSSRSGSQRKQTTVFIPPASSSTHSKLPTIRHNYHFRTTRALVIVSSVYVLLNLPSHAFRSIASIMYLTNTTYDFSKNAELWQNVLQLVYYMNFASNVFLYSASSRSFRSAMRRLCGRWRHKLHNTYTKLRRPLLAGRTVDRNPRRTDVPMTCLREMKPRQHVCCKDRAGGQQDF